MGKAEEKTDTAKGYQIRSETYKASESSYQRQIPSPEYHQKAH